jgi:Zn finger protein HypA/HybF involved in hydrogenase expression
MDAPKCWNCNSNMHTEDARPLRHICIECHATTVPISSKIKTRIRPIAKKYKLSPMQ